jgi:hypothetical protein
VKLTVRCGAFDGSCRRELGTIDLKGFPDHWFRGGNYDRLRDDQRHYVCPKHGAMQIHETDVLHRALNPGRPWIMARSVLRMGDP